MIFLLNRKGNLLNLPLPAEAAHFGKGFKLYLPCDASTKKFVPNQIWPL